MSRPRDTHQEGLGLPLVPGVGRPLSWAEFRSWGGGLREGLSEALGGGLVWDEGYGGGQRLAKRKGHWQGVWVEGEIPSELGRGSWPRMQRLRCW